MQKNMGIAMRWFYGVSGVGLVVAGIAISAAGVIRWVMLAVGIVALLEGAVGF